MLALALARPQLTAGVLGFALVTGAVASNAFYGQPSAHPGPLAVTRAMVPSTATAVAAAEVPEAWQPSNDPRIMTVPLVADLQLLLREAGYYNAAIDGRPGQATDMAIRQFQADRGLTVDGTATPYLLSQVRQLTAAVPSPDENPQEDSVAGIIEGLGGGSSALGSGLVRNIQSELTAASVAELSADGILGEQTRAAIRSFQALEGMDVTGEPSEPLLDRLREVTGRS